MWKLTRVRRHLPAFLALLAGVAAVVLLRDNLALEPTSYDASAAGMISQSLVLVGPFATAAAAFQSARVSKVERMIAPVNRLLLTRVWRAALPGLVIVLVGFALTLVMTGYRGVPNSGMLGSSLLVGLGVCSLGAIVGRRLPDYIAVPAMFIGTFIWFSFATAVQPFWLRHVSGALQCCLLDAELPARAAIAPPLFTFGCVALALSATVATGRLSRAAAAAVGVMLCLGAWSLVRDLGFAAEEPRRTEQVCDAGEPRICSWPEHAGHMRRLLPAVRSNLGALSAAGVDVPAVVAEPRRGSERDGWAWSADPRLDAEGVRLAIAHAAAADLLPNGGCAVAPAEPTDASVEPVVAVYAAWLAVTMGVPSDPVRSAFGDGASAGAETVRSLPSDARRRWVDDTHLAVPRCWISADELRRLLAPSAAR